MERSNSIITSSSPRLLRAARGETVDRPPVWMMRQAGRYMKTYRELCDRYPDFRTRSETPDLAIEISLQPFHAFEPDGVILFSDILTLLPGIGLDFYISEDRGPIIDVPIRSLEQVQQLQSLNPEISLPFVGEILKALRQEVGDRSTVLGFVGAPWTLATYAIEGKTSSHYSSIKQMAFSSPEIVHALLEKLTDAIVTYACYQIDAGAQIIQIFDSWAGQLSPADFEIFALPYQQRVVQQIKVTYPETPLILTVYNTTNVLHPV
jgi:uroporphyrinogen decarboxylase